MNSSPPQQLVDRVTELILELVQHEHLRASVKTLDRQGLWQLDPTRQGPAEFAEERSILASIVAQLKRRNALMLSERLILTTILYGVVAPALWDEVAADKAEAIARQVVEKLLTFEAYRDVDIPILNLRVGTEPYVLGPVAFARITHEDETDSAWSDVLERVGDRVYSYGRVNSPGDLESSAHFASEKVDEALLLLRAIGVPIDHEHVSQIGVLNQYSYLRFRPHRLHPPQQNLQLEHPSPAIRVLEPFKRVLNVAELVGGVDATELSALITVWKRHGLRAQQGNAMERKVMSGFRWIGEATKPDTSPAKFLRLAIAFELLIGGEAQTDYLTVKGLTAGLSERAAFLIHDDLEGRKRIHRQVTDCYRVRSDLVHGRSDVVSIQDLEIFASLVRQTAWALLRRIHQLNSIDQLQTWVLNQRYSSAQPESAST